MKKSKMKMETPNLIQRLNRPYRDKNNNIIEKLAASLSFGGGYKNGGLSDQAMEILQKIFSFDYMGAAEFEFGSVPDAMVKILKNYKKYTVDWIDAKTNEGVEARIWVLCHKDIKYEVMEWLSMKAADEKDGAHTHESIGLNRSINDKKRFTVGWLDLNNGFFFFIDETMANMTMQAFKIKGEIWQ